MTPADIMNFRIKNNLNMVEMANMIGVHKSQITRWEVGNQKIPTWLEKFVECLRKLGMK